MINKILTGCKILLGISLLTLGIKKFPWKHFEPRTTIESVMQDVTDSSLVKPDSTTLLGQFHMEDHKFDGATFRYTDLNEVSLNQVHQVVLPATPMILSNELDRDKQIRQFKDSVGSAITQSLIKSIGRSKSSIYLPISKELTLLSKSNAQSKSLIIFSDLLENSADISLYGIQGRELLNHHPDVLIQRFEELSPLPNLLGINVYLIYQPDTIYKDEAYKKISEIYKTMLVRKGAIVTIEANLLKN